jgi:hypothetical protein
MATNLENVQVDICVELGRKEISIDEVRAIKEQDTIDFDKLAGEAFDILINGRLFAEGEIVVVTDLMAVGSPTHRQRGTVMNRDKQVRPFAWPTTEPEIPTPPAPAVPVDSAPQVRATPTPSTVVSEARPGDALPEGISPDSTHAFLWENAAAAAVLRTMMQQDDAGVDDGPLAGMTARQLAAAIMAGLGIDVGTRVMRHLHLEAEAGWVGRALAEEPAVIHRVAMAALQAVRGRIEAGDYLEEGGADYAARLLESAFYRGRVSRLLRGPREESGFRAFKDIAPEQIAPYISHEHPQTIAMCLSQLDSAMAARILAQLPPRMQADVSYRVATIENVTPEALLGLEEAMEASMSDILSGNVDVGGRRCWRTCSILRARASRRTCWTRWTRRIPRLPRKHAIRCSPSPTSTR